MIYVFGVQKLNILNVTFDSIFPTDTSDVLSSMITINNLDLESDHHVNVKDIVYQNSSISFMKFSAVSGSSPSTKF